MLNALRKINEKLIYLRIYDCCALYAIRNEHAKKPAMMREHLKLVYTWSAENQKTKVVDATVITIIMDYSLFSSAPREECLIRQVNNGKTTLTVNQKI